MRKLIKQINDSRFKAYIIATGGGSKWIGDFLSHGGGSATLIGFEVPYHVEMTHELIGGEPSDGKYVGDETARRMATAAFYKCRKVASSGDSIGIGLTCSLIKPEGERAERLNHGYVAIQTCNKTTTIYFNLNKGLARTRTRSLQEAIISDLIYECLKYAITDDGSFPEIEGFKELDIQSTPDPRNSLLDVLYAPIVGCLSFEETFAFYTGTPQVIFPGSFNPVHKGHLAMAKAAKEVLGIKPHFEISMVNFEKPPLDYKEVLKRVRAIKDLGYEVIVSNMALFTDKAENWPHAKFIMGVDTYERISPEDRMYNLPISSCVVFGRSKKTIPWSYSLDPISKPRFGEFDFNISSTDVRNDSKP